MKTRRAEQDYRQRVARVVAAIVADPMAEHCLEDLARIGNFSPFHFHRVYSSIAGESVAATVRRVRLALAARLLGNGDQSITQVALAAGYDSPQAFTRAFGRFTGQSPSVFQQQMHQTIFDGADGLPGGDTAPTPRVRLIERPAQRVVAMRHKGPLATIPHTHRRLQIQARPHAVTQWLGAFYGDPEEAAGFRYYAAAVSPEPWPIPCEVEELELPAGRYAVHRLVGPYARIDAAVNALYVRWLPASGYEPDNRPSLEHYLNSSRNATQTELQTDLMIPIRTATPA